MVFYALFALELLVLFFLSRLLSQSLSNLFFRITRSKTITIYLLSLLFFPGVAIHELSHLLSASILFVPVGEVEFIPQIKENEVKLGSVGVGKTDPVRRAIIGFAPVIVGTAIIITFLSYFSTDTLLGKLIAGYIFFEIGNTMFSSKKDFEGTIELLVAIALISAILTFFGFHLPQVVFEQFSSLKLIEFIKKSDTLLLIPVGIDIVFFAVTKAIIRN